MNIEHSQDKPIVVFAIFLVPLPKFLRELNDFAIELKKLGASLILGVPSVASLGDIGELQYELIEIQVGLRAYQANVNTALPLPHSITPYENWLAESERVWWSGVISGDDSLYATYRGIEACRKTANDVLQAINPTIAFFWSSGLVAISCVWHDVARSLGIPSMSFERVALPGTWMFDAGGMCLQSDLRTHPALRQVLLEHKGCDRITAYRQWYNDTQPGTYDPVRDQVGSSTRESIHEKLHVKGKLVTVFGSVTSQAILLPAHANAPVDCVGLVRTQDLLNAAKKIAARDDVTVVFKPHPGEFGTIGTLDMGGIQLVEDIHPCDLIAASDAVIAGFTTLSCETLLLGVPLIHVVKSFLYGTGAAYEALDEQSLCIAVDQALALHDHENKQRKAEYFLDALLTYCLFAVAPNTTGISLKTLAQHCVSLGGNGPTDLPRAISALTTQSSPRHAADVLESSLLHDLQQTLNESMKKNTLLQAEMASMRHQLAERDARLAERDIQLADRDARLADRDIQLAERDARFSELDKKITSCTQMINEHIARFNALTRLVTERDNIIAGLRWDQEEIKDSCSWRMTAPFRYIGRKLKRVLSGCHDPSAGRKDLRGPISVEQFCEADYLAANPDVAEAVAKGEFASGWAHYETFGWKEVRQLTPYTVSNKD